jgi:hypothetical protein
MARFDGLHSGWDLSSDIYYGIPIWASQRVNDEARADEALFNVAHTAWAHDRRWPFDALAAGTLLLACTMGGIRHYGTAPPTGGGRRRQVPFSPPG